MILRIASWLFAAALLALVPAGATSASIGCTTQAVHWVAGHDDCGECGANAACADKCLSACIAVLGGPAAVQRVQISVLAPVIAHRPSAMRTLTGPEPPPPRNRA